MLPPTPPTAAGGATHDKDVLAFPSLLWSPTTHQRALPSFKAAVATLLLLHQAEERSGSAAALVPPGVWLRLLEFCPRRHFCPPLSQLDLLRKLLARESLRCDCPRTRANPLSVAPDRTPCVRCSDGRAPICTNDYLNQ